ncbi:MAG: Glutamine--scyllo-inositol transaminase [Nitrospirae bacterium]|nr:MAG: Glutamine--scyllo-inositol transaminase [Nitrospirota bacterium]
MDNIKYQGAMPYFPAEDRVIILKEIEKVLTSGQLTQGVHLKEFEQLCARMTGIKYAFGVNSGGTALELVLTALKIDGGEVIVPTDTFVATPNSVVRAGGVPVFADISEKNLAISVESLESCITRNTRGVILVHMFGLMATQIKDIQELCKKNNLFLMEDAAHAHGATYLGKPAGSLGIAGCFSYYATKVLTTGEGGAITTDNNDLAVAVKSLRDHGRAVSGTEFDRAGNNFRLAEIPAILGVHQHKRLEEIVRHAREIASIYHETLKTCELLTAIDPEPHECNSYWRYPILLDKRINRNDIQKKMAQEFYTRITWMYEPLCHQQPYYAAKHNSPSKFPVAIDVISRLINLPTHMSIGKDGARSIAEGLLKLVRCHNNS